MRPLCHLLAIATLVALFFSTVEGFAQKSGDDAASRPTAPQAPPPPEREGSCVLSFVVLRDFNGKPVKYASVILHPVSKGGKQSRGGQQLKTDIDGKTTYAGVPFGKLRVQVLATGLQTFGEDYDINQKTMEIVIKLKRPQDQYSIYK